MASSKPVEQPGLDLEAILWMVVLILGGCWYIQREYKRLKRFAQNPESDWYHVVKMIDAVFAKINMMVVKMKIRQQNVDLNQIERQIEDCSSFSELKTIGRALDQYRRVANEEKRAQEAPLDAQIREIKAQLQSLQTRLTSIESQKSQIQRKIDRCGELLSKVETRTNGLSKQMAAGNDWTKANFVEWIDLRLPEMRQTYRRQFDAWVARDESRTKQFDIKDMSAPLLDLIGVGSQDDQLQIMTTLSGFLNDANGDADPEPCVVCLDQERSHIITPCGHACLCETCARRYGKGSQCPICQGSVNSVIRLYL